MAETTDWAALWRELSQAQRERTHRGPAHDVWQERARDFHARVNRHWLKPDATGEVIARRLADVPEATLLDVGAGTGAWAVYLAPGAGKITALDPSPAMLAVLRENLVAQGITNVEVLQASWPEASVAAHDFSLCSHGMYGAPDLPAFVRRMEEVTRRTCFLVLRAPSADSVMAEAARRVWGYPYDSPNFQVAYNVLLEMGIRANVLVEEAGRWAPRTSADLPDALAEVKRRLLLHTDEHDVFLLDLLRRRLTEEKGELVWPRDMRSALVWWQSGER